MNDFDYELLDRCLKLFGFDLDQNPSLKELKSAYRKLIAKNHPDKVGSLDKEIQDLANERTQAINEAFDYIEKYYIQESTPDIQEKGSEEENTPVFNLNRKPISTFKELEDELNQKLDILADSIKIELDNEYNKPSDIKSESNKKMNNLKVTQFKSLLYFFFFLFLFFFLFFYILANMESW